MKTRVPVVVGLGFGDEGKGSVVDFLVRERPVHRVVRFSGGPQAAHHVVTPEGRSHCFAQLGAGWLAGARETWLRAPMAVDPLALAAEAAVLGADLGEVWVDPDCVVVTPWHAAVNQLREGRRGADRHGSCGRGVGEAVLDAERPLVPTLRVAELGDASRLRLLRLAKQDLAEQLGGGNDPVWDASVEEHVLARHRAVRDAVQVGRPIDRPAVWEGAQGVLLDRDHGFFPHVSPGRTTFLHAAMYLGDRALKVGVLRAYHTRHGAGPFPSEDPDLRMPEPHNGDDPWQGPMRFGAFDAVLARYALEVVGGVDVLALTCLDLAPPRICVAWEVDGERVDDLGRPDTQRALRARPVIVEANDLVAAIEAALGRTVDLVSTGPTAADKQWRHGALH